MISVGSRDGRKRLELGLGLETMEETELEEGEAPGYPDGDRDSTIDPDIAFSYIGEKVQQYLGHHQKDFEGAKFNGYGSFLPTYQRSPSWSQIKSPAGVNNYNFPRSPRKLNSEDQRSRDASGKALSVGHFSKGKGCIQSNHIEEPVLKGEAIEKSVNPSDHRTLKVRIKVGSENLSTQKNADLYSGLGLVVSPSSSLDGSPTTSVEKCSKRLHEPDESPTSILEVMTSVPGELPVSPLPEDLFHLTEKGNFGVKREARHVDKMGIESSRTLGNGFHYSKGNQRALELKNVKSYGKDDSFSIELESQKNSSDKESNASLLEKVTEIDASGFEELVTNALRLPFLSSSQCSIADPAKEVPVTTTPPSSATEGRKALDASGDTESSKQLLKSRPLSEDPKPVCGKSSTGGKRKQKVTQDVGTQGVCTEKDESVVKSCLPRKGDISCRTNGSMYKNNSHHLQKDHQKAVDRYEDIFRDAEFEDEDNESISGEMASAGRLKDSQIFEKRSLSEDHCTFKGKCDGKNSENPLLVGTHPRFGPPLATHHGNKLSTEAPTGATPLVEEWVFCDKCKKWRLLPLGTDPKSLPRKWVCRMLNWLSGMNRCSITEEETTNATRALSNPVALVPDAAVTSAGAVPIAAKHPHHEHQIPVVHTAAIHGKKVNSVDFLDGNQQFQWSSAVPKYNDTKEEKVSLINCSGEDADIPRRSKREADVEGSRTLKRIKSQELHSDGENWNSDNGVSSSKVNNNTSGIGNDKGKYINQKDLSGEAKRSIGLYSNAEKHVPGNSDVELLNFGKSDEESVRKGKEKEPHSSLIHTEPISSSGKRHPDSGNLVDELSHWKEKKARVSKSEEQDPSGSKTIVGIDHKSKERKDQHNSQYLNKNSDMGSEPPLLAANSSSSKLSGSHKNKNSGQETKGSPVESVSSSPLKGPNAHKVSSTRKSLDGKDNFHDSGFTAIDSPRRISGDKDEGRIEQIETVKEKIVAVNNHATDGDIDQLCQSNMNGIVKQSSDKSSVEKSYASNSQNRGFHVKKSGKELSSHSKDKASTSGSDMDKANIEEKLSGRRIKSDEKSGNSSKGEKLVSQKDSTGRTSNEASRGQGQRKSVHDKLETENNRDKKNNLEHDNGKLSIYASGKSSALPPLARGQTETVSNLQPGSGSRKENGVKGVAVDGCDNGDTPEAQNQRKRTENQNGQPKRHPTPNSQKARDGEAPSPLRRDSSSHAANNALKEAKDLKHLADRFKNSGSTESIGMYFQAALKFLHGASLLESGSSEASKHGELAHSMQIYSSTAKLCEFCAREYEKSKDMAAAALAYKCMEVAYLRVVYSLQTSVTRDRTELQAALQIAPSGESPSSSASDVDNHQVTIDKAALAKAVGSPQVSGSHVNTSRNRSGFSRILNYAQDVNSAMEASRKSRIAFTATMSKHGETSNSDGIYSLKRALDFNFQDVESLLRLVRVAMEAIGR